MPPLAPPLIPGRTIHSVAIVGSRSSSSSSINSSRSINGIGSSRSSGSRS